MTETRLTCCLTFDFDAMSVWIGSYKSVNPSEISRGEFGAVAIARILDLLARHDLPGTFCIPGHTAYAYPDLVKRIHDAGHEIAHHGWVHENPADFDEAGERANMEKGFEALHASCGVRPVGYRSPAWDFSERTTEILQEFGFLYDSSLMGDDYTPYYMRSGDRAPADAPYTFGSLIDIVELPVSWTLDDFPYFELDSSGGGLKSASHVEEIWRDEFSFAHGHVPGGIYNLTMHPQVIGRGHRLMMLERLIGFFKEHEGVRFDTLGGYAISWREANTLEAWRSSDSVHVPAAESRR
ncbi:MAG: polysaccharide deacetylase [Rhodospirillaceae bacterium]|nr:polysaccharide deacetylase [Rhodospirillaceae bacterium]